MVDPAGEGDDFDPYGPFDEFLWPLIDGWWSLGWPGVGEEQRLRQRLKEILAHVMDVHVRPRVRRLGTQCTASAAAEVTQAVVVGPAGGEPWQLTLREPVPRALRDEWRELGSALRQLCQERARSASG